MKILIGTDFIAELQLPPEAIALSMLWVPSGTFMMGEEREEPDYEYQLPFQASVSQGFWLGRYPVTQAQWVSVMGKNPSQFQYSVNCPVESINWYDAMDFCTMIEKNHQTMLPKGYHFSLPTEAQWEFACRAGTQSIYYNGNNDTDLTKVAWYKMNSGDKTHPVGEKAPNRWGFYDMHGNVDEWCFDPLDDYPSQPTVDWVGRRDETSRVMRGGSWGTPNHGGSLGAGFRTYPDIEARRSWFGFRLCLRSGN